MRLPSPVLSLLAGTVAGAAVAGCGGSQVLAPQRSAPENAPQPTVVAVAPPRQPATNTNQSRPPTTPVVTTSTEPEPNPEDYPVDCGRG